MKQHEVTKEIADELIARFGSAGAAADAIVKTCRSKDGGSVKRETVRFWLQDAAAGRQRADILARAHADELNRIAELLKKSNIPIEAIGKIKKVKLAGWGQGVKIRQKDGTHRYEKHGLYSTSIVLDPSWKEGPTWPVIRSANPVNIQYRPASNTRSNGIRIEVALGDEQISFLRNPDTGKLLPMHDEAAMDVAVQLIGAIRPKRITHFGDLLDLSEMSRYLQIEEFYRTTQPSIDRAHRFLADCEAAAGPPKDRDETEFIDGNHERRLAEYVQKNARAAFRLRPAMATPESWPDLSLAHLLRFKELRINNVGMWPGGEKWLTKDLVIRHEPPANKADFGASVIYGHRHRALRESFTRQTHAGDVTHTLYGVGCLCRTDRNPDKLSLMRTRVASDRGYTAWQQGIAVIYIDEKTGRHQVDHIDIVNGQAMFNGRVYSARKSNAVAV